MKKIFLSLPMSGRSDEEIRAQIEEMKAEFLLKNPFDEGEEIVFVDNFENDIDPSSCIDIKTEPLLYLGEAIRKLAYCDGLYIGEGSIKARGCGCERGIAYAYGIPCYILFEQRIVDMDKHCWKPKLHSSGSYIDLRKRVEEEMNEEKKN